MESVRLALIRTICYIRDILISRPKVQLQQVLQLLPKEQWYQSKKSRSNSLLKLEQRLPWRRWEEWLIDCVADGLQPGNIGLNPLTATNGGGEKVGPNRGAHLHLKIRMKKRAYSFTSWPILSWESGRTFPAQGAWNGGTIQNTHC